MIRIKAKEMASPVTGATLNLPSFSWGPFIGGIIHIIPLDTNGDPIKEIIVGIE